MGPAARDSGRHPGQTALGLLGLGFTISYLGFFYAFRDASEIADASVDGYLEVVLLGIPPIVLFSSVMWLRESAISRDLHSRVPKWAVGMGVLFAVVVSTVLFVIESAFDSGERWLILLMSLGFGATSGTIMGILEIRAMQYERDRNQSRRKARRRERERKQLEYLNHYLRHEVLNEANKITGYATYLQEQADADGTNGDYLSIIRRSGEEIAEFIQSIRTILETADHQPELEPVDVVSVLETEVERVRRRHSSVTVSVRAPDSAHVLGGDLLNRIFSNLLENAIDHNDQEVTITVAVESGDDRVTVRLRDDGSGIPDERRDGLFDPPESGDHGYGLFLANNLVEVYGGQLELDRTGADGTAFVAQFRASSMPTRSSPDEGAIASQAV